MSPRCGLVDNEGFITRKTFEISHRQGYERQRRSDAFWDASPNYGDIGIENMGDDDEVIKMILSPLAFRCHITAR